MKCVSCSCLLRVVLRSHPFIVNLEDVFLTPKHLAIVMEYVPGGNLYRMLLQKGKLKEVEARWLFQQLIVALEFIHRRVRLLPNIDSF